MIIKKFVAKSEKDAIDDAERELGKGIVIMNVRPVKQDGFLSFLRPPRVEVTVALEDEPEDVPLSRGSSGGPSQRDRMPAEPPVRQITPQPKPQEVAQTERLVRAAQDGTIPPLRVSSNAAGNIQKPAEGVGSSINVAVGSGMDQVRRAAAASASRTVSSPTYDRRPEMTEPRSMMPETAQERTRTPSGDVGVIEEKLDSLHSLLEERMGSREEKSSSDNASSARSEGISAEMLTFVKLLYNTLLANEVDEIYANQLTDEVEKMNKPDLPLEYVLANVYQKMVLKFGKSETIQPAPAGPKAIFFIGPTGVGKTTTIAKLASELYVMQKKKVALLTVDTYRIAAAEQLKTYASIMEIPCRVIYSVEEMRAAAEDLSDYDFLLVDTAGHSMRNEELRNHIEAFLHAFDGIIPSEIFLVLSATTKYRDLIDITDSYSAMTSYRLIFTKMDETKAAGNLYNIKLHTGAPMSYITNGQNVPDDIAVFDAQGVVKGLLGGKKETQES